MTVTLASLKVVIDGDTPAKGKIEDTDKAIAHAGETARQASEPTGSFFGKIAGGALELGKALPGFGMLAGGITDFAGSLVKGNAEFETYQTQFGVLLGSADAAKQRIADLAAFGASTPFDLPGVVRADKILQGFGLHSAESAAKFGYSGEQIRTIAGDVASGTGAGFEEMSNLLGKFSAGATGEAISRMGELGIASRDDLAKMGLEFDKSGSLVSPLPQAMNTVLTLMKSKYGGMMQAQSSTFDGMMSNMGDWIEGAKRTMMAPIFDVLKDQLGNLLTFLGSPGFQAAFQGFAQTFASAIGIAINVLGTLLGIIGPILGQISSFLSPVVSALGLFGGAASSAGAGADELASPLGILSAAFGAIGGLIGNVIRDFGTGGLGGALDMLAEMLPDLLANFQQIGFSLVSMAGEWAGKLVDWIAPMIPVVVAQIAGFAGALFGWLTSSGIPALVAQMIAWGDALWTWIAPKIPIVIGQLAEWGGALLGWLVNTGIPSFVGMLGNLAQQLAAWIGPMIGPATAQLGAWASALWTWLINTGLPALVSNLSQWASQLWAWIAPQIGPMLGAIAGFLASLVGWLLGTGLPTIIGKLVEWGGALVAWIAPMIPPMLGALGGLLLSLGSWLLTTALPAIVSKLAEWGGAFLGWVGKDVLPFIGAKLGEFLAAIVSWIAVTAIQLVAKAQSMGQSLIDGLIGGLRAGKDAVINFITGIASGALDAIKNFFGIQSPSTEMHDVGTYLTEGLVGGMSSGQNALDATLSAMGAKVLAWGNALKAGVGEALMPLGPMIQQGLAPLLPAFDAVFGSQAGGIYWKIFGHDKDSFMPRLTAETTALFALYVGNGGPWVTGLHTLQDNFTNALQQLATQARTDGVSVGSGLGEGIRSGIAGAVGGIAAEAASAVRAAINAAQAEADAHSPSRKTRDMIGKPLMQGIGVGITEATPDVLTRMRGAVGSLIAPPSGNLGAGSGAGSGASVVVTVPVTINGLTGDINNPTTWAQVALPIAISIRSALGSSGVLIPGAY